MIAHALTRLRRETLPEDPLAYVDNSQIEGLGTAGTPTGGVVTVQGNASGTAVPVTPPVGQKAMALSQSVAFATDQSRADNAGRVSNDPTTLLYEPFASLDLVNLWTTGGTAPTIGTGKLTCNAGLTANAFSYLISKPTFLPGSSSYLSYTALVQLNAAAVTGNARVWGIGTITTPTSSTPIQNGSVYEIDPATGSLWASCYSGGAKLQAVQVTRPTDGALHRYNILYRGSVCYFTIDGAVAATINFPAPAVDALSILALSVNGAAAIATAPVFVCAHLGISDTGKNSVQISDATYPWRKASVDSNGAMRISGLAPLMGGNFAYDDMNAANGGVARSFQLVLNTATTVYSYSGSGALFGFMMNPSQPGLGGAGFVVTLILDGATIFAISTVDLYTTTLYDISALQDEVVGWSRGSQSFRWKCPGGGSLKFSSSCVLRITQISGTAQRFLAGLVMLMKGV